MLICQYYDVTLAKLDFSGLHLHIQIFTIKALDESLKIHKPLLLFMWETMLGTAHLKCLKLIWLQASLLENFLKMSS